ncbi:DUF4279 domain-containing protein [Shimazuella kribbensis]|uniref:DUF4279 domain-containing protein n=1 Tax=Shimazuella kribbensis TaxID=139808 RepID=UPI0003FC1E8E|nr:DUF4279 domain-containing protein [Shimazuella kribbensis]
MEIRGKFVFSIRGLVVDFDHIEQNLLLAPTKKIKKGELLSVSKKKSQDNVWSYEKEITSQDKDELSQLYALLEDLYPYRDYISSLRKYYSQVMIDCYLRSDFGQMGFSMNSSMLNILAELKLDINFHLLSYGEA